MATANLNLEKQFIFIRINVLREVGRHIDYKHIAFFKCVQCRYSTECLHAGLSQKHKRMVYHSPLGGMCKIGVALQKYTIQKLIG